MKTRKTTVGLLAATILALVLCLSIVGAAGAASQSFAAVSAAGAVGFQSNGALNFATFAVRAVGPAAPGEDHQPARGSLLFVNKQGVTSYAAVEHIHAHSANEVHFGGIIQRSRRSVSGGQVRSLRGRRRWSPGRNGDLFSILVTASDTHEHGVPAPVVLGNLVVRTPGRKAHVWPAGKTAAGRAAEGRRPAASRC